MSKLGVLDALVLLAYFLSLSYGIFLIRDKQLDLKIEINHLEYQIKELKRCQE